MKFINYLQSISGVGIFPMISMSIFFIFFLILIIWALKVNKEHILEMKNLPLEPTNDSKKY
jgi:hypothetical protein